MQVGLAGAELQGNRVKKEKEREADQDQVSGILGVDHQVEQQKQVREQREAVGGQGDEQVALPAVDKLAALAGRGGYGFDGP